MYSDPLTLAIISMIVGMVAGAALAALSVLISNDLHRDDPAYPTNDELEQLCLWYDEVYEQKGAHEK